MTSGCIKTNEESTSSSKAFSDQEYFEAAKTYLTYNTQFKSQTDVSHPNLKKIEFNSLNYWGSTYREVVTERKDITINGDKTFILIKRIAPSRKDNESMKVSISSGDNFSKKWIGQPTQWWTTWEDGSWYKKTYEKYQCDAVVINAEGQGACLEGKTTGINLVRISQKLGNRIATSCWYGPNSAGCGGYSNSMFSPKEFDKTTGTVTLRPLMTK